MKKPSKAVQRYTKEMRIEASVEYCKNSVKSWSKRVKKLFKQTDLIFDPSISTLSESDVHNQFCITISGYIYDGNKVIKDMKEHQVHLKHERRRLHQMDYNELREEGLDRLYADDAEKYIKDNIKKIDELIKTMNHLQFELISDALMKLSETILSYKEAAAGVHEYKALTGVNPITNAVSVTWFSDGIDVMHIPTPRKPDKEKEREKDLTNMLSKINAINDMMTEQTHDSSVAKLITATEKHTKEISRLTEAVKKLETSESEKVHYEKPVVGKSPEEVTSKKSFSVTSEN